MSNPNEAKEYEWRCSDCGYMFNEGQECPACGSLDCVNLTEEEGVPDMHYLPGTPESIKSHSDDYKDGSWSEYSLAELGQWIALLCKRSSHRATFEKRKKDLHDARNYLSMLCAHVASLEDQLFESIPVELFNDKDIAEEDEDK